MIAVVYAWVGLGRVGTQPRPVRLPHPARAAAFWVGGEIGRQGGGLTFGPALGALAWALHTNSTMHALAEIWATVNTLGWMVWRTCGPVLVLFCAGWALWGLLGRALAPRY